MSPNTKKALIISGIAVGAVAAGFLGYKLYIRLTKKVVDGKHNTIIVDEEEPEDVEVIGLDEKPISEYEPNWQSPEQEGDCPAWYGDVCG